MADLGSRGPGGHAYTRRDVLRIGAGALAAGALAPLGCSEPVGIGTRASIPPLSALDTLFEPERRSSANGLLETTLRATAQPAAVAGKTGVVGLNTFDGQFPGPTLVCKAGDTLRIHLRNELSVPTNLHFQGLHVSPSGNGDNPLLSAAPGATLDYEVRIPATHAGGVYRYHSLSPGRSYEQVSRGLTGLIVIESGHDAIDTFSSMRRRTIGITNVRVDTSGNPVFTGGLPLSLVNGQVKPVITMRPNEAQYWRIANLHASASYSLTIDGVLMEIVAEDGSPLAATAAASSIELSPGKRMEVVVTARGEGLYDARSSGLTGDESEGIPHQNIATVMVTGSPVQTVYTPAGLLGFRDLRTETPARFRTVTIRENATTSAGGAVAGWSLDGKPFDPAVIAQTVRLGSVEEWTIVDLSGGTHAFHLHTNQFMVTKVRGVPVAVRGYQDSVALTGSVTIRVAFDDFTGKSSYHCASLGHADSGLMAIYEIVA